MQGGHAELAIHRTAHLAGDADGVALAFGHEDGFHRAAVVEAQQVAARAVGGFEKPVHRGKPDGVPFGEFLAHTGGQGGDLHQVRGLAAVKGFVDLAGAVPGLIGAQSLAQIGQVHAHKGLRHSLPVYRICRTRTEDASRPPARRLKVLQMEEAPLEDVPSAHFCNDHTNQSLTRYRNEHAG